MNADRRVRDYGWVVWISAIACGVGFAGVGLWERFHETRIERIAREAMGNYASLCDSEILDKLAAANDGDLTGVEALAILEQSRPVVQKHTWKPLADEMTALQTDGVFRRDEFAEFINQVKRGIR
jgi:hypothetical protein